MFYSLRIYYNRGECLAIQTVPLVDADEVAEIVSRLSVVTRGCEVKSPLHCGSQQQ